MSQSASPSLSHKEYNSLRYIPSLDGLRAVAVALVITCHLHTGTWIFLSGYVGVTIFFVLSGYLITRLALIEEHSSGNVNLSAFYIRRSFRIFPLYYLVLGAYAVLILTLRLWPAKVAPFEHSLAYYVTYLQEVPFWRSADSAHNPAPFYHSWSLGIEEKFYLLWPLFLVLTARMRMHFRAIVVLVATLLLCAEGFHVEHTVAYHPETYGFILMGALLALVFSDGTFYALVTGARSVLVPCAAIVAAFTQFYLMRHTDWRGLATLYAICITMLLGCLVSSRGLVNRLLSHRIIIFIGGLSYGIYLVHILCLGVVERLIHPNVSFGGDLLSYSLTLIASIGVAFVLNRTVERPFIAAGRRFSKKAIRSATPNARPRPSSSLNMVLAVHEPNLLHPLVPDAPCRPLTGILKSESNHEPK